MDQPMNQAPLLAAAAAPSDPPASDDDPKVHPKVLPSGLGTAAAQCGMQGTRRTLGSSQEGELREGGSQDSPEGSLGTTTAPPPLAQGRCFGALLAQATHWSSPLVCDHLTSQDRLALFSTCRGASRTVLSTAQHASIRLHASHSTSMGQQLAIKGAMQSRGELRTKLDLTASHPPFIPFTLASLGPLTCLDELTVEVQQQPTVGPADRHVMQVAHVPHLPAETLTSIGGCCPNLRALSLHTPLQGLPPPRHFPSLEELVVHLPHNYAAMERLVHIISLHVKQLAVLRVSGCLMPPALLPTLLSPDSVGSRLHTLELHLLPGPIMGAAPFQQHFSVRLRDLITEGSNWSCTLVTDHLDPAARLALYRTCRGSRCLVLEAAEHATIRLRVTPQHLGPLKLAGLLDTKSALQVRGRLPTKLHLSTTTAPLMAIMVGLMGPLEWLSELALEVKREERGSEHDELPITVLTNLARCCPNLRALDVRSTAPQFPSPHLFPSLRDLTVRWPWCWHYEHGHAAHMRHVLNDRLARTVAPFVPQLTKLGFNLIQDLPPALMPLMLHPGNVRAHMRVLHLDTTLDDRLLSLLMGCALALDELQVQGIHVRFDTHARTPAPWRRLQLRGSRTDLVLSSLSRLPVAPAMEFVCNCDVDVEGDCLWVTCDISSEEAEAVPAAYKVLRFTTEGGAEPRIQFFQVRPDGAANHPQALRAGLALMRGWEFAANITSWLWAAHFRPMTFELLQELQGLPRWSCVYLGLFHLEDVPAGQLYSLLRLLPDSVRMAILQFTQPEGSRPSPEQVESLCLGAPTNRTAETPLRIALDIHSDELVQAIKHKMGLDGSRLPAEPCLYPHVTIVVDW